LKRLGNSATRLSKIFAESLNYKKNTKIAKQINLTDFGSVRKIKLSFYSTYVLYLESVIAKGFKAVYNEIIPPRCTDIN